MDQGGEKWLGYRFVLKVELIGFDDGLDVVCVRKGGKDRSKVLVWPNLWWGCYLLRVMKEDWGWDGETSVNKFCQVSWYFQNLRVNA